VTLLGGPEGLSGGAEAARGMTRQRSTGVEADCCSRLRRTEQSTSLRQRLTAQQVSNAE
jgi:hypothetical protein